MDVVLERERSNSLKRETILKKLKRYAKSLEFMEAESMSQQEFKDAEHFRSDVIAFQEAIKIIEGSNT